MVGLVITIAQRKGDAGKTTLATQFAVTWARRGARVAALDIDPQGSFSAWVDLRRARLGAKAIGFDFAALPGWRAAQWVDDRLGSVDLVVIDVRTPKPRRGSRCARHGSWWFPFSHRRSICGRRRKR
jgi:chromosome partitioning protein